MTTRGYRPDIDGLRTLAVLPVVLFHAGFSSFSGGYIGVDVFFVISGYLITSILVADAERGTASILGFYDRRIRRIFPALITVIVATIIGCLFIMLPSELMKVAQSAVGAVLFYSNIYFWGTTDYFSGAPYENPLLHTWSLAVEEQFYIFWPLILLFLAKGPKRKLLLPLTLIAAVISFSMAEYLVERSAKTAFYMFPPRAWELFAGAILALLPHKEIGSRGVRQVTSFIGAMLLVVPIFVYEEGSRFPAAAAVPPVLGTALLILANVRQDTWMARLLSNRVMVGIGLISYSLYLWHWPVISLFRLAAGRPSTTIEASAIVLLSIALAWISWKYVEAPFRYAKAARTRGTKDQKRVLAWGLVSITTVVALSGAILIARGFPQRLPADAAFVDTYPTAPFKITVGCALGGRIRPGAIENCMTSGPAERAARMLIWGDSHARAYAPGLTELARQNGSELLVLVRSSCAPLPGVTPVAFSADHSTRCAAFNGAVLKAALDSPTVTTVVIGAYWSKFTQTDPMPGEEPNVARLLTDARTTMPSIADNMRVIRESLDRTAAALEAQGKQLVIMKQPPNFATSARKCLARARWARKDEHQCDVQITKLLSERRTISSALEAVATNHRNVRLVDPVSTLCHKDRCAVAEGRFPLYRDAHHLSDIGSRLAAKAFPRELLN
nr:acyltransferase family protein [uncultured Sphingomonas sp.]